MSRTFHRSACLLVVAALSLSCAARAQAGPSASGKKSTSTAKAAAGQKPAAQASGQPDLAQSYYHYMLAHYYEQRAATYGHPADAQQAIAEYQMAMKADPGSKFLEDNLAGLYFNVGKIDKAIKAAQQRVKRDPNDIEGRKLLARIYLNALRGNQQDQGTALQMLRLAIAQYQKLVELQPNNARNHLLLAQLYAANQEESKADAQFQAALNIKPYAESTVLGMARFYSNAGHHKKAIEILRSVPASNQTPRIEYALGLSYLHLKKNKQAIAAFRRALRLAPGNQDVERSLGKALFDDQQYDAALRLYQTLAASDPEYATAFLRISDIQRHNGEYQKAYNNLMKAKTLKPNSIEILYNEGLLNDALGHLDKAEAAFQKLVKISNRPVSEYSKGEKTDRYLFLNRLAHVYREQNKFSKAIAIYEQMVDLGGKYSEQGYQSQADTYSSIRQYDKARKVAERAVQGLPNSRSMKMLLASTLADTGEGAKAIALDKSLLTGKPRDRQVYLAVAQLETRLRHWRAASKALRNAEKLSKTKDEKALVYFVRGSLLEQQNRMNAAEAELRKALAIEPDNAMTLNYLGYMLANRGKDLPQALAMIKKAVKLNPMNYAYLDSLGWAYFKIGDYKQAEKHLQQACMRDSTDPTVHDHLGQLYEKMGRLKEAAKQWELSLKELQHTLPAYAEPGELGKVQERLKRVRVRLAKESPAPPRS